MNLVIPFLMSSTLVCGAPDTLKRSPGAYAASVESGGRASRPQLVVPKNAIEPVKAGGGQVVTKSLAPVTSLGQGMRLARAVAPQRIIAAREVEGFFFYATVAPGDEREKWFVSGYAIKRGGRELVEISVW